jgi:hypothetical protein
MITQDFLKEHFSYDADTGILTRKKFIHAKHGSLKIGDKVGVKTRSGHLTIKLFEKTYMIHRIIWFYVHGHWPNHDIDHINGIGDDNRIVNLRDVTKSGNLQNMRKAQINNKSSGLLGVYREPATGKYQAKITVNRKPLYLGSYRTKEEAHEVYLQAKRKLHPTCTI